jgi:hypothetical protein
MGTDSTNTWALVAIFLMAMVCYMTSLASDAGRDRRDRGLVECLTTRGPNLYMTPNDCMNFDLHSCSRERGERCLEL